jgi:hypothetical protein
VRDLLGKVCQVARVKSTFPVVSIHDLRWRLAPISKGGGLGFLIAHLVLFEICLDLLRDNSVEDAIRDVLHRLAQGTSHLVANLALKEII